MLQRRRGRCLKPALYITTEGLFCVPTRSALIALFARMLLQAEVPGLDAGKPGSVGLGQKNTELSSVLGLSSKCRRQKLSPEQACHLPQHSLERLYRRFSPRNAGCSHQ